MFTIVRVGAERAVLVGLVLSTVVGIVVGRTVLASDERQAPRLADLRAAPDIMVVPEYRWEDLDRLVAAADAVGVVRVVQVSKVKEGAATHEPVELEIAAGRGEVSADVLHVAKGRPTELEAFAFDAFFQPGGDDFAIPAVQPPLEVGETYLVFLKGGRLLYPGGTYELADGRLWYTGQWAGADSRLYPAGVSGLTPEQATALLQEVDAQ